MDHAVHPVCTRKMPIDALAVCSREVALLGSFSVIASLVALVLPGCGDGPGFTDTASMATPRDKGTATLLPSGKVLIAGGSGFIEHAGYPGVFDVLPIASAELYDPATGTFTATGSMTTTARARHLAILLARGKVLIVGGDNGFRPVASAELYDSATGTFTATGSMTTPRSNCTATLLPSGKVLIAGGGSSETVPVLASAELYDPAQGTFTATGSLNHAREGHSAILLSSGKVLVVGGFGLKTPKVADFLVIAELYDPATGAFTRAASMTLGRTRFTATMLPSGNVLIAGGYGFYRDAMVGAEVYDSGEKEFVSTGSLAWARAGHTATLLPTGEVLVVGGAYTNNTLVPTGELYRWW